MMTPRLVKYREEKATPDSAIVRIVDDGGEPRAFVRCFSEDDEKTPFYPTEEVPVPDAIRLASTRQKAPGPILVQLEDGAEWNPDWGELE